MGKVKKLKEPILIDKLDVKKDIGSYLTLWSKYKNESVKEIICSGVLEFIEGKNRDFFMDEAYRVLVLGGKMIVRVPYWNTVSAIQDYNYAWPLFCEASFCYFNKAQRESVGITEKDRPIKCDFEVSFGYDVPPEIANKNEETRSFQIKHYANTIAALNVVLTKPLKKK